MKQFLVLVILVSALQVSKAQSRGTQQPQTQPTAEQIEKRKKEAEQKRIEFVNNFVNTLEGDAFQKQIVRQYIDSYVDEKMLLLSREYKLQKEREDAFKHLDETHFLELKELISDGDYQKIQDFISGKYNDKGESKKKKKKRKKKKKDTQDNN